MTAEGTDGLIGSDAALTLEASTCGATKLNFAVGTTATEAADLVMGETEVVSLCSYFVVIWKALFPDDFSLPSDKQRILLERAIKFGSSTCLPE